MPLDGTKFQACDSALKPFVAAVVVTFNPDEVKLIRLMRQLNAQVQRVIVVDNGSSGIVRNLLENPGFALVECLDMTENFGVAAAINRGVDRAIELGATYVLLSDQDSELLPGMVRCLLDTCEQLEDMERPFAAVGPQYFDSRTGFHSPFVRTCGLWLRHFDAPKGSKFLEVDFLITSGTLIPLEAWHRIGGMDESLFIDYVDIEWGLRARSLGYSCFGVFEAKLAHELGDGRVEFFGLSVPVHAPFRHYYQIRNPLLIYRCAAVPLNWKIVDAFRLVMRFGFYSLVTRPRRRNIHYMIRGFFDGIRGVGGKMPV